METVILPVKKILAREPPHKFESLKRLEFAVKSHSWDEVPPIIVFKIPQEEFTESFVIYDGNNRHAVAERHDLPLLSTIPSSMEDVISLYLSKNLEFHPPLDSSFEDMLKSTLDLARVYHDLRLEWWWRIVPCFLQYPIYTKKCKTLFINSK